MPLDTPSSRLVVVGLLPWRARQPLHSGMRGRVDTMSAAAVKAESGAEAEAEAEDGTGGATTGAMNRGVIGTATGTIGRGADAARRTAMAVRAGRGERGLPQLPHHQGRAEALAFTSRRTSWRG